MKSKTITLKIKKWLLLCFVFVTALFGMTQAQVIIQTPNPPFNGGTQATTRNFVSFVIENTSNIPYNLTEISTWVVAANNNATYQLLYKPIPLSGPDTIASFIPIMTSAQNAFVGVGVDALPFVGLNFQIPANTQYRFILGVPASSPVNTGMNTTTAVLPNSFSASGVTLKLGDYQINGLSVGYTGSLTGLLLNSNPFFFCGSIKLVAAPSCVIPPIAGTSTASPAGSVCPFSTLALNLSGNNTGTSQTYQWQSAPTAGGPYTNISGILYAPLYNHAANTPGTFFYRCGVSCSGSAPVFSTPVQNITNSLFPAGTYTINAAGPATLPNFQSFTAAASAISCGIAGPVVFNVAPGSGPYIEQMILPATINATAVNTVTFNGNGNVLRTPLTGPPNLANRSVIKLDGADWIRINNLNLIANTGTNGWGVWFSNAANNNIVSNCTIDANFNWSSTNVNFSPIIFSQFVAPTSNFIVAGNTGSNNLVTLCTLIGGANGISLQGPTQPPYIENNQFINNNIWDFASTGVSIVSANNTVVSGNDIQRPNKPAASYGTVLFNGVSVGIGANTLVEKNRIHNICPLNPLATTNFNGIISNAGTLNAGQETRIINNMIYDIKSTGSQHFGISHSSSAMLVYHNMIILDDNQAIGGFNANGQTYGITFCSSCPNGRVDIKNNIIVATRRGGNFVVGGGQGSRKGCIYFPSIVTATSNNNVLFIDQSTGGFNAIGVTGTSTTPTQFVTLADWQTANGNAWDQQSVSVLPVFTNPATGNYLPLLTDPSAAVINNKGSAQGVTTDITAASRNPVYPDPGAYEFTIPGTDAAIAWIAPVAPTTANPNTPVTVRISNTMSNTINSITLTYTVNGVPSAPQTFNSLNLLSGSFVDLTFAATFNFAATSTLSASILTADDNLTNNNTSTITLCPALIGVYKIDKTNSAGTNFTSIQSALNAMYCGGVAGAVTMNVEPGTGTYFEQLEVFPINGASATSTITFNGNGNTIGDIAGITTSSANRAIIKINGADRITFNNFVVKNDAAPASAAGWGFWLINEADNNTISNCVINLSTSNTLSGVFAGIVLSSANNGLVGVGLNGSNNLFTGNTINGGQTAIAIQGPNATPFSVNNTITNNTINDMSDVGIVTAGSINTVITNNLIQRPNRNNTGSLVIGINVSTSSFNIVIERNIIRNLYANPAIQTSTNLQRGIQVNVSGAPIGSEPRIVNNLIAFKNGYGPWQGIQVLSGNALIYHNTISMEDPTGTPPVGNVTRGIDFTGSGYATTQVFNNVVSISRGGSGIKACIYFTGTFFGTCDYNDWYMSSTGGTSNFIGFYFAGINSLATWQSNSGNLWDMHSVSANPFYQDIATFNYIPTNVAINNVGANVGVTSDLDGGAPRGTSPDLGAYEFDIPPIDIGAIAIVSPNNLGCYSSAEQVYVTIKNWGSATINFTTNPGTVTCIVSGMVSTTLSGSPTGTLASGATMDVLMTSTLNMSVFGPYIFNATATCTGDGIAANNTLLPVSRTSGFTVGSIVPFAPNVCGNNTAKLSLNGSYGGNIEWQQSLTGLPGSFTTSQMGGLTYNPVINQLTYFQAVVTCPANLNNGTTPVVQIDIYDPQGPTVTTPAPRCGPGSVTLAATVPNPYLIKWYDSAGFQVGSGSPITSPSINSTSTFYAVGVSPQNSSYPVGKTNAGPASGTAFGDSWLVFNAYTNFVLNTVKIYPFGPGLGGAGTVSIGLKDSSGTIIQTANVVVNANPDPNNAVVVTLNFNVPAGQRMRLVNLGFTGAVTSLRVDGSGINNPNGIAFPYTVPGIMSIDSSSHYLGGSGTTNYYFFYDWKISAPCESAWVPVVASVTSLPSDQIVASDDEFCANASTVIASSLPINNNNVYVWTSNPAGFNQTGVGPFTVSPQVNTTYTLSVYDNTTQCTLVTNKDITVHALPVPSAFSNAPICENSDLLLFAFDGQDFVWTGPNNFSSVSQSVGDAYLYNAQLNNSGNYTVNVTNFYGCVGSETINVVVNDNPEPYIASQTQGTCTGFNDGTFQIGVNGGTPFFSYNEPSQGQNFSGFFGGLANGTYTVDVTDLNQCVNQFPLQVTISTVPNAAPVISCPANITVNNTPGLCGAIVNYPTPVGSDVCPILGTAQTAGLASGWTFPVGTTVNTFEVTDVEGVKTNCSFSVTVTENEAPTITNCPADFASCNPVTWTPPTITDNCSGLVISSNHAPGNFPAGPTTVTYTATDAYNNVSTCSFVVTRYEESVAASSITSDRDFNNICLGETVNLTINGGSVGFGSQWKWYTGSCAGTPLPAFNGMSSISVTPAVTTTYFARAEGLCNTTACVSITVVVSNVAPAQGVLAITSMPPFGASGVTGTINCTTVPNATYYRWSSILGHINAVWFPSAPGPVDTNVPSVNVLFNQSLQNYQIRVVAGNACGRTNNVSAHIRGTVPASTCLTGPVVACPNTTATYSVASCPIPNTNTYQWAVTGNATITAGQGTTTITVSYGAGFTNGTVCVNGITNFGLAGPQTCLTVSNNAVAPGAISGNSEPCQSGFETYTIAPVAGATSYLWTTNITGATANGTTTSGTVQFPSGSFSGLVCVQALSSCGASAVTCFNVASGIPGVPGPILGPESGICGAVGNYALSTSNANSYNWILPSGVTFASPNGSNAVQLQFPSAPGSYLITVEAFYDCGSATSTITVNGAPGTPTVTPATICAGGTDETYIASSAGADSYTWTTSGAIYEQCTNPNCSNYYIIWDTPGGSFSVNAVNACGVSAVPFSLSTNCRISEGGQMDTKIYPNPTTGMLTVEFTSYAGGTYNMMVTDMSGRMVFTEDVKASSGNNQHMLNLESANPGMYMLYVKDGKGQISVTKLTIE